jgi:hypothetical protein
MASKPNNTVYMQYQRRPKLTWVWQGGGNELLDQLIVVPAGRQDSMEPITHMKS